MTVKHRHKYTVQYWQYKDVCFGCDCGDKIVRKMTKEEYKRQRGTLFKSGKYDVHQVWHKLVKAFGEYDWEHERSQNKKLAFGGICERFAKKYPDQVYALRCDDSAHASSDLILITHEAVETWMGVTALMFPQCDGREPAEFFLYPDNVNALLKVLTKIQKQQRKKGKQEDKRHRKDTKWWNERARYENYRS